MSKINGINVVLSDDGKTFHPVRSVKIPGDKKGPTGKLICWYGTRDTLSALKESRQKAQQEGKIISRVTFTVDAGDSPANKIGIADLPSIYFLNIVRLKIEVSQVILDIVAEYDENVKKYKDAPALVGDKPEVLDYVWQDPRFSHLRAIAWSAPLPNDRRKFAVRQLVAIDPDYIEDVVVRTDEGDISQPKIQMLLEPEEAVS